MEKGKGTEELSPSMDLCHATEEHLNLLEMVDSSQDLYHGNVLQEAIRRYLVCWLPLMAQHGDKEHLLPALDIQWVWYCHALSPDQYRVDVQELTGKYIPHAWISLSERLRATDKAKQHWEHKFENEPFLNQKHGTKSVALPNIPAAIEQLCKKIEHSVFREKNFYYQVALPHNRKESFIQSGINRYKRFLTLVRSSSELIDVSTTVELIWRTHILQSESYTADCMKWFGYLLEHYPAPETESAETAPDESSAKQEDKDLTAAGAAGFTLRHILRRGESPVGRLIELSNEEKMGMSAKASQFSIEEVFLEGYRLDSKAIKLLTTVELTGDGDKHPGPKTLSEFKGYHYSPADKRPIKFTVDPQIYSSIKFTVTRTSGSALKGHKTVKGSYSFDVIPLIETCPNVGTTFSETGTFELKDHMVQVSARGLITPTDRGPVYLTHIPCSKEERVSVEGDDIQMTLIRTGMSPSEVDNIGDVLISTHRFTNRSSRLIFTCKFYQQLPYLSLVQVLSHSELVAEGHFVGAETLPEQAFPGLPSLDDGECAFVIKNSQGDWGILVAGESTLSTGTTIHRTEIKLYTIAPVSRLWTMVHIHLPNRDGTFVIQGSGYTLDLRTGSAILLKSCPDVAELVALMYGLASLHGLTWMQTQERAKTAGKGKPTVRFASSLPKHWSEVAKGNRFLSIIKQ